MCGHFNIGFPTFCAAAASSDSIGLQLDDMAVAKLLAVLDAILFVAGAAIILANIAERCLEGI
jgi:hypothetical protein